MPPLHRHPVSAGAHDEGLHRGHVALHTAGNHTSAELAELFAVAP